MSERIKEKIGEELYKQILAKGIKANEFDLLDGFVPRSRLNEATDKLKAVEEKVKTYEGKMTDVEKLVNENKDIKDKYTALDTKYKTDLENKDKEILNVTKKSHLRENLISNGAKHINLLMKEVNLDNIKIDGDNITGIKDIMDSLKKDYADMFAEKKKVSNGQSGQSQNKEGQEGNNDNDDDTDWSEIAKNLLNS